MVALEFYIDIVAAVERDEAVERFSCAGFAFIGERSCERTFVSASEADQALGEFFEVVEGCGAFGFGCLTHFETRDELAKVLITGLRFAEKNDARGLVWIAMRKPVGWD